MSYLTIKKDVYNKNANLIIEAHKKYIDWWLTIDLSNDSSMAPMALWMFCERLLIYEDEYFFDKWINADNIIIPKSGSFIEAKRLFKNFILDAIRRNELGIINLTDKNNPFKLINKNNEFNN